MKIKNKDLPAPSTFKKYLYRGAAIVALVGAAYSYGTFNPNPWKKEKMSIQYEQASIDQWRAFGFLQPSVEYSTNKGFVLAVAKCVDYHNLFFTHDMRVPKEIIVAMAVLETGWGKSRFAQEANNLFGIRTWDPEEPQLKPLELPNADFGVKKYRTKCDSVLDMIEIINRHPAYEGFRSLRTEQLDGKKDTNSLIDELHKWSTNPLYTKLVKEKVQLVIDISKN